MPEKKSSFILHHDTLGVLSELSNEEKGMLLQACYDHNVGNEVKLPGLMKAVFKSFEAQFERDRIKYLKACERNKANGSKGGRPKTEETETNPQEPTESEQKPNEATITQNNPVGFLQTEPNPKQPYSDSVSDSEELSKDNSNLSTENKSLDLLSEEKKEKEISNLITREEKEKPQSEIVLFESEPVVKNKKFVPPSLQQITDFVKENNYNVSAYQFLNHYQTVGWKVGKNPMKDWQSAVRNWHSRNQEKPKSKIVDTKTIPVNNTPVGRVKL